MLRKRSGNSTCLAMESPTPKKVGQAVPPASSWHFGQQRNSRPNLEAVTHPLRTVRTR